MADIYDEIINRTFQSTVMGTSPNALEEDTPSVMGLGAPMSGREGTTSQQDVEEDARPASATGAIMDYLQRLAVEYGYNAKAPQAGVRVPATTPTLGTSKMHDIYNTPLYDFMRNNEGGVKDDVTVWVRENRDLPSEVLDDYLSGIQDGYDYRLHEGITRTPSSEGLTIIGDRPMTDAELAPLTDTPIEVEELPSGSGLMSPPSAPTPAQDNNRDKLIDSVFKAEGGYSTDKNDTGNYYKGEFVGTNHGISAPVLADYLGRTPTVEDMKALTKDEAREIAATRYYDRFSIEELPSELQEIVFHSVYMSESRGVKAMQRLLGVEADGIIGPKTIEAMQSADFTKEQFKDEFLAELEENSPTWDKHGKGWTNRFNKLAG